MVVKLEDVYLYREGNMILGNVNWQIDTGEHWVLFGLNGSGN